MKRIVIGAIAAMALALPTPAAAVDHLSHGRAEVAWKAHSKGAEPIACNRRGAAAFNCWGRVYWASSSPSLGGNEGSFACLWRVRLTDQVTASLLRCG